MRGTRWLILLAIAAILGGVATVYRLQKAALDRQAPARPKALPLDLASSSQEFFWEQKFPGQARTAVRILAKTMRQARDNSRMELEAVELRTYDKIRPQFNLIRCARAQFFPAEQRLYSEGQVEITLAVPESGAERSGRLVAIRASGITFDWPTGIASTEQPAEFEFENGKGRSMGAAYSANTGELQMFKSVEIDWKDPGPRGRATRLQAGSLLYKEAESKIWLNEWARMAGERSTIESGPAIVTLDGRSIRRVEAQKALGKELYPGRTLEYSAAEMTVDFTEGVADKAEGRTGARLVSTSASGITTVTADRIDMDFDASGDQSVLSTAVATGKGMLESRPVAGTPQAGETRVLRSDMIQVKMREGGRELESLETPGRAAVEFLPNRPEQRHRTLTGDRLSMAYGPNNQIRSFHSVNVETRTEPNAEERARARPVVNTRSKTMDAFFAPETGQLARLEQKEDFAYQEGDRRAVAAKATMDQEQSLLTLDTGARVWDPTGSTSADRIVLDQHSGNFTATGHVNSSRVPDKTQNSSEMLSGGEPIQGLAARMTSSNRNRLIRYESNVVLWQGANRIQADAVDIDRENRRLTAVGHVVTQFLEEAKPASAAPKSSAPVFTVVRSERLVYTDQDRLAHYTGGARLNRPGLEVKAAQIRAWLSGEASDARVEKAWADGKVEIAERSPDRTRTGSGEHAEYYTGEQKVILRGGEPQLTDSRRGNVRGTELTYWANDDRLLVTGAPGTPAKSQIRRK